MENKNKKRISIISSALTLGLTACGGNAVNTSENINIENVVDINPTVETSLTLGASLNDYFNGKVTTVTENCINNEDITNLSDTTELDISVITVPPTETIPTTIATTKKITVTTPFSYDFQGYIYEWGSVNVRTTLNVRSNPNTSSEIIGSLKANDEIYVDSQYITSNNKIWYYITYPYSGFVSSEFVYFCGGDKEKPVIYLYPPKETKVSIKLELNGKFTYTYPTYNDGWNVTAYPDGKIIDCDNNEYSYLFWEGNGFMRCNLSSGFIVERSNVTQFLREKLFYMGLNPKEANEFIVYWAPRLMKNEYSLVSFQWKEYEDYAKLSISPKPDSILRVFMVFKSVNRDFNIVQQKLPTFKRTGFTVIEWGGSELSSNIQL